MLVVSGSFAKHLQQTKPFETLQKCDSRPQNFFSDSVRQIYFLFQNLGFILLFVVSLFLMWHLLGLNLTVQENKQFAQSLNFFVSNLLYRMYSSITISHICSIAWSIMKHLKQLKMFCLEDLGLSNETCARTQPYRCSLKPTVASMALAETRRNNSGH